MVWAHFLRESEGHTTVEFDFTVRGRSAAIEAQADPMALGPEFLLKLLDDRTEFRKLLTPESGFAVFSMFPRGDDWRRLYEAWLSAAGLTERKLAALQLALDHMEDVEADFLRAYGLDIRDWFTGHLPSRRVANLVLDLMDRPETLIGAQRMQIVYPLSKAEIMLAQSVAANSEAKKPNAFLVTHEQRDVEIAEREKRERMIARGLSA